MANNNGNFEQTLFKTADKLRKNIDAAEYKHITLGLIFLKYISDSFEQQHNKLIKAEDVYEGADPEDKDDFEEGGGWNNQSINKLLLFCRAIRYSKNR